MGEEDDVLARRERRLARRDRTKSPHNRHDVDEEYEAEETGSMGDASSRRTSAAANFSASKLVENLKEANETTFTRLRRVASTDGMAKAAGEVAHARNRRPVGRTMSAQNSRRPERRLRAAENDVLSQSLGDNLGDDNNDLDNSNNMSASQTNRRRAPPLRTKSTDSGLPRGATQRAPRARRRPTPADREEAADDLSGEQTRRRLPPRSKSAQDAFPPRGVVRPSRPGRRRPQAQDEEDVFISDSDEEEQDNDNNIDRSSRRRGVPPRSRSSHDGPTRGPQRTSRPTRRRPSGDSADASPKRSSGPGLQRSLTGTPPPSGSGPGLMRSHTSTNPRSARTRGGRNTAQEIAQVASNRERSPDPSADIIINDAGDPMAAREAVRHVSAQHQSSSPVKSRQERRRLREGKEREALERRAQGQQVEDEVLVEPEKKEEPWMRRLKKNVGERAADDPFNLEGAAATHTEGSKGSSIPRLGEHNFAVDPTFGVFPAVSDMPLSTIEADALNEDDGTAHLSITGGNKLDFSTIS